MIGAAFYVFWAGVGIVLYTYLGYGFIIYFLSKIRRQPSFATVPRNEDLPHATLVIAAYNEESFIEEKIHNTLALDYPEDKLDILIVTDGSTDRTAEKVRRFARIKHYHEDGRKGKIHAVNRVMKWVQSPIVIFCDANTYLNPPAIKNIVRHYQHEKTGGVAGEKRIFTKKEDNASGSGEGLYWKYESFLKKKDSEVFSVIGAAGELFSVRTELFKETEENLIIEDFVVSVRIAMNGYRFIYEPEAVAMETASVSVQEEWKRKVRIAAGGFQSMLILLPLLNIFRYGILSFQYISHRVLRWTLAPLFLPLILGANLIIALQGFFMYEVSLALQLIFYLVAILGWRLQEKKVAIKGFFVPYYFSVMNLAVYAGLLRFIKGSQSVIWEKAARAAQ
jgi:biofilm PGA synthesis N-glycosyltransferase PgaC